MTKVFISQNHTQIDVYFFFLGERNPRFRLKIQTKDFFFYNHRISSKLFVRPIPNSPDIRRKYFGIRKSFSFKNRQAHLLHFCKKIMRTVQNLSYWDQLRLSLKVSMGGLYIYFPNGSALTELFQSVSVCWSLFRQSLQINYTN